jgi:tetratricopeptide (TPR) repeat protein
VGDLVSLQLKTRRGCVRATSALDWYERGLVLEMSDPNGAMSAYRRALAGRPDLADAYNNLGRLHHDQNDLVDAEALYRLAICAANDVALYWFNLGVVLEDLGRSAEAIVAYERALVLDAGLADAHFNLARQLELVGKAGPIMDELVMRRAVRHLKRYRDLVRFGATS